MLKYSTSASVTAVMLSSALVCGVAMGQTESTAPSVTATSVDPPLQTLFAAQVAAPVKTAVAQTAAQPTPATGTTSAATTGPAATAADASTQTPASADTANPTVKIDNFTFGPTTLTVPVGATVTWVNQDDIPHTVVSDDHTTFKSKVMDTDEKFSFTFTKPGDYAYFCSLHPHMVGKIVVKAGWSDGAPGVG